VNQTFGNRMLRTLIAPGLLVLGSLFAPPALAAEGSGFYFGVSVGPSFLSTTIESSVGTVKDRDAAFRMYAGKRILDWLSVEFGLTDIGRASLAGTTLDSFSVDGSPGQFARTAEVRSAFQSFTVSAVFDYPFLEDYYAFGRAGVNFWNAEMESSQTTYVSPDNQSGGGFYLGAGAGYRFNDHLHFRAELEYYAVGAEASGLSGATALSIGVQVVY